MIYTSIFVTVKDNLLKSSLFTKKEIYRAVVQCQTKTN